MANHLAGPPAEKKSPGFSLDAAWVSPEISSTQYLFGKLSQFGWGIFFGGKWFVKRYCNCFFSRKNMEKSILRKRMGLHVSQNKQFFFVKQLILGAPVKKWKC